jgi:repressor LexA
MAGTNKTGTPKATPKTTLKVASRSTTTVTTEHDENSDLPHPLSVKEKGVLEFLELYMREKGVSPTYSEICQHFGFASYNSVQRYLKQLESKGYIRLPWANQKRAITLLRPSNALQAAIDSHIDSRGGSGGSVDDDRSSSSNVIPAVMPTESLALPLLGRVAAGAPIEAIEHDEYIDVPASLVRHADRTFALRVQGQSMIEDGILDGDVILVQRQSSAVNGEIVVAVVEDEATVKRLYQHRSGGAERGFNTDRVIELRPANSSMTSMWFDPGQVQIKGIVVGLIRKF